jgi:hypothetical protein
MTLHFNKFRNCQFVRVIALLFLAYTAIDIACPELCRGERTTLADEFGVAATLSEAQQDSAGRISTAVTNKQDNETPTEPCSDEDCFCCCAHIVPAPITVSIGSSESASLESAERYLTILTPALPSEFHPPRFA